MNKIISITAAGLMLAMALPVLAATTTATGMTTTSSITSTTPKAYNACVKAAAKTRDTSISTAYKVYLAAKKTDMTNKKSSKVDYTTYLASKKAAQAQYKTDVATCHK